MQAGGVVAPAGSLGLKVIRASGEEQDLGEARAPIPVLHDFPSLLSPRQYVDMSVVMAYGKPQKDLPDAVNLWRTRNLPHLWRGLRKVMLAKIHGIPTHFGALWITHIDGETDQHTPLGLASLRVVTTTGGGFIVDAFQNLVELENMKFHGLGTGTNAEATGDTALQTELTTQYNPDNTRATGSTTEASALVYRTVGTNTVDASAAVTEHGVLSQAATGGGVLLDRTVFSVVNLGNGDSLQTTYDFTITAGS